MRVDPPANVLVAEGDADILDLLSRMLARSGYTVRTAMNGKDAVRGLKDQPVALVITDILSLRWTASS
jgi:DNA-binding NtrC family response regulator